MALWPSHAKSVVNSRSGSLVIGTYGNALLNRNLVLQGPSFQAHKHVMGVTGQGKSKLLASMFVQLLNQGVGVGLVDPHSDLADDCLAMLLSSGYFRDERAYHRLLYVDFSRGDRFLPLNVLKPTTATPTSEVVARLVVEVCKRVWPALAGGAAPQFEDVMQNATVVLADNGLPLTALQRLLTDKPWRDGLLDHVADGDVARFFTDRFDRWGREAPLMIESSLRRVSLITFSSALRYCLGQTETLDFRQLMDSGTSIICNLGGLDEETQRLLGSLLTASFETAALSRADIPEEERRPYHLLLDEFSMFSAQSEEALSRVLSLARKYGLSLTMAHQTWSQLSERLQGALQNAVEVAFQLGFRDAELAAPRFLAYDPYRVKHEVSDVDAADRSHPVYFNVQEQLTGVATALQNLQPRQAVVAVGKRTVKIRTLSVPKPTCTRAQLQIVKERYAQLLLTPREHIAAAGTSGVARQNGAQSPLPTRKLPSRRERAND